MILAARFDHLEESFSYKEVQFKKGWPSVKTSCHPAENVHEAPDTVETFLVHCWADIIYVSVVERNQQQLRDRGGVERLVELLTQEQVLGFQWKTKTEIIIKPVHLVLASIVHSLQLCKSLKIIIRSFPGHVLV